MTANNHAPTGPWFDPAASSKSDWTLVGGGPTYEKCVECHLFVEENYTGGNPTIAAFVHLHRGDEADEALDATHEAKPSGQVETLTTWERIGPPEMIARFTDPKENPDA